MVSYQPMLHTTAERELHNLSDDQREELTTLLKDVCTYQQPTTHAKVRQLEGQDKLFRVRTGDVRAICRLEKPNLMIIKCGERSTVYNDVDTIHERLEQPA